MVPQRKLYIRIVIHIAIVMAISVLAIGYLIHHSQELTDKDVNFSESNDKMISHGYELELTLLQTLSTSHDIAIEKDTSRLGDLDKQLRQFQHLLAGYQSTSPVSDSISFWGAKYLIKINDLINLRNSNKSSDSLLSSLNHWQSLRNDAQKISQSIKNDRQRAMFNQGKNFDHFKTSLNNFKVVFASILIFLLSYLIFFFRQTSGILRDINILSQHSNSISLGRLENAVPQTRNDELGVLQLNFEQMRTELKGLIENFEQELLQRTEHLNKACEEAERANDAKSIFLATMSHEIRTPLNAILGLSHLMGLNPMDSGQRDYLSKIESSGRTLLALINDILDFSKIEADRISFEYLDFELEFLSKQIADVASFQALTKGLEFGMAIDPQIPALLNGDHLRINQIILNLCSNAIKFTEKGSVNLEFNLAQKLSQERIMLSVLVTDTGKGIDHNHNKEIFEPFSQEDNSITRHFGGTGLGLAISHKLARLMGGDLILKRSKLNEGSQFELTIPLKVSANRKPNWQEIHAKVHGARILVVEDHVFTRRALVQYLDSMHFRVSSASTGHEALQMCMKVQDDPYQILLLDWHLPDMNAGQLLGKIHDLGDNHSSDPMALIVTAYDKDDLPQGELKDHVDSILSKPVQPSMLHDAIVNAYAKRNSLEIHGSSFVQETHLVGTQNQLKVLLVEDNQINQIVAEELLRSFGHQVIIAHNGQEAVEQLTHKGEFEYDVVLMDVQMPVMNGIDATAHIRKELGFMEIPIIALTADVQTESLRKLKQVGINTTLPKPFEPESLRICLRDLKNLPKLHVKF